MPGDLSLARWGTEAVLLLALGVWVGGLIRLRSNGRAVEWPRVAAFAGGLLLAACIFSPATDALGERFFSARMLQHLVLLAGAAPLLAFGWPEEVIRSSFPLPRISGSEAAWAAGAALASAVLFWHVPAVHDWAVMSPMAGMIEHLSMLLAAVAFWRFVVFVEDVPRGVVILIVWLISLQGALLSAVIMFAPVQLCGSYADNPLSDQIMAGLLMCIPMSLVYAGSTVWALTRLLGEGRRVN